MFARVGGCGRRPSLFVSKSSTQFGTLCRPEFAKTLLSCQGHALKSESCSKAGKQECLVSEPQRTLVRCREVVEGCRC